MEVSRNVERSDWKPVTSPSGIEVSPHTAEHSVRIATAIAVMPYLKIDPEFHEHAEAAANRYLEAFLSNVEAFMADAPGLSADSGLAALDESGEVVEFNLRLSVPESSDIVAAMRARDLLPGSDLDDYDESATADAHDSVDRAVAEHLRLMARSTGRLFRFVCEETRWAS
jgi:hypothetical protein